MTKTKTLLTNLLNDLDQDTEVNALDIDQIQPDPDQPRKVFDDASIKQLSESIQRHGLLQPIVVSPYEDHYIIIAGERRYRACRHAGLRKVPVKVIQFKNGANKMELSLIENIQREDLNPIDIAQAFHFLVSKFNMTQDEIAKKVAKSRSYVANIVRLLNLPVSVQEAIRNGSITYGHAKALIGSSKPEKYLDDIAHKKLSVREVEKKIRAEAQAMDIADDASGDLEYIRATLEHALQLKTKIEMDKQGNGKIILAFKDVHMLENLLNLIRREG